MKKAWVYKRKNVKGWWVGWYESGNRKAKALPNKKLAEHFCQLKYSQLNSDVFTGMVAADRQQMVDEYREAKKVQGVTEGTLYEIALSLRNFERLVGKCSSKQITQSAIDFEKNSISTTSRKTKKSMASRPVSVEIMTELSKYVCSLDVGQEKLFSTKFKHRKWRKICKEAGLADLKFHDLRKTFCSLLAQNGVSTAVTQRLLEHSSPNLTNRVYTNVDPVLRHAVEQLHAGKWLQ